MPRRLSRWFAPCVVLLLGLAAGAGCAGPEVDTAIAEDAKDPALAQAFEEKLAAVTNKLDQDEEYREIPLSTQSDQDWFATKAFLFWDGKMTEEQFIEAGLKRFPGYEDSFRTLAEELGTHR